MIPWLLLILFLAGMAHVVIDKVRRNREIIRRRQRTRRRWGTRWPMERRMYR